MYGPMGPGFDVFSLLLPMILIGGLVYLALVLAQRRNSSLAAGDASAAGPYQGASNAVFAALYTVALAALLAAFVGFGIEAAYPSPTFPEDPYAAGPMMGPEFPGEEPSPEFIEAQRKFQTEMEAYQQRLSDHHEVASAISLVAAVALLLASLLPQVGRLPVIGQGVALGGVLTLLYGIVLAVQTQNELLRFAAVSVGLVALLVAIYLKFRTGRTAAA